MTFADFKKGKPLELDGGVRVTFRQLREAGYEERHAHIMFRILGSGSRFDHEPRSWLSAAGKRRQMAQVRQVLSEYENLRDPDLRSEHTEMCSRSSDFKAARRAAQQLGLRTIFGIRREPDRFEDVPAAYCFTKSNDEVSRLIQSGFWMSTHTIQQHKPRTLFFDGHFEGGK